LSQEVASEVESLIDNYKPERNLTSPVTQVPVSPDFRKYTLFATQSGQYEFLLVPFSITKAKRSVDQWNSSKAP